MRKLRLSVQFHSVEAVHLVDVIVVSWKSLGHDVGRNL